MQRHPSIVLPLLVALSALVGVGALAQPSDEEGGGGLDRRTQAAVDRMMAHDKNSDGKLTPDELPARLAARLFEEGDADKDGVMTREEVGAVIVQREGARRGGTDAHDEGEQGEGEGASEHEGAAPEAQGVDFEGLMKQAGASVRDLKRSALNAQTMAADLQAVQRVQEALVLAKGTGGPEHMAPQAVEKYGDDAEAYARDMRQAFVTTLRASIDLEQAFLDGDHGATAAALDAMLEAQKASHDAFQE